MRLERLHRDLRVGLRSHARTPIISTIIVATLALGIAASAVSLCLVNGLFFRPAPIREPDRFARVYHQTGDGTQFLPISYPEFEDLRRLRQVFDDAALEEPVPIGLGTGGWNLRVFGEHVSDGYFSALGVQAARGRMFSASEEASGEAVVVLSDRLWRRQFAGRLDILNQDVRLNRRPFRVIGVAPAGFDGTILGFSSDLWIPFASTPAGRADMSNRGYRGLFVMAHLAPGVDIGRARSAVEILARRLDREYPQTNRGIRLVPLPEAEGRVFPTFRGEAIGASTLMIVVALLLTAIACANVAGVLLVRADGRSAEIGVRLALGASRGRIVSQLLTEAALLSVAAGVIGLTLAVQTTRLIAATRVTLARGAAVGLDVSVDWRVIAASVAMCVITTILFGLVPALDASRQDLMTVFKKGIARQWRRSWSRRVFLGAQIVMSMALLAAGGLFARSLHNGRAADLGFDPANVVTTAIDVSADGRSEAERKRFWTTVIQDVRRLPQTESASLTYRPPLELGIVVRAIAPAGFKPAPGDAWPTTEYSVISTDYFRTLRIPLVEGRDFTDQEVESGAEVVIINDVLARRLWPDATAVGKRIVSNDGGTFEVVGVAQHSKYTTVGEAPRPYLYAPMLGDAHALTVVSRGLGDSTRRMQAIGDIVQRLDPGATLYDVGTLSSRVSKSLAPTTGAVSLLGIISMVGLGLTALGLFGSVAHAVGRRTYEIGVRRALGAPDASVVWLVGRDPLAVVAVGVALGVVAAFAAAQLLRGLLYDVSTDDPVVFAIAPLVLVTVCLASLCMPIRRAITVEPSTALRCD